MKRKPGYNRLIFWFLLVAAPLWLPAFLLLAERLPVPEAKAEDNSKSRPVVVLTVEGAIGPASSDYINGGLSEAAELNAELVVLKLDTPGGLDTAMREIIKDIIASPVPVATFVYPSGARAASAGTYILYASHIAAMSPGTNLGAATPVAIGGGSGGSPGMPGGGDDKERGEELKNGTEDKEKTESDEQEKKSKEEKKPEGDALSRKQIEDATAYIRGLAQMRGRNVEWAEKAVREAVSLSSEEAVAINVIDLVAADTRDLLAQLDGREVEVNGISRVLNTSAKAIVKINPDWRNRFLATITNPSVAYILMMIGIYGLLLEFYNPGFFIPGVSGAISLLLALYAFQLLPVSYAGLGLILLGIGFMVAELMVPSFGILGFGGVIAFVIGSVMLMDTSAPGFTLPWSLIIAFSLASVLFVVAVIAMALKARQKPVVSGAEEMVGAIGVAIADFDEQNKGWITVHSESWKAICQNGQETVKKGQQVKVLAIKGLELDVEAFQN